MYKARKIWYNNSETIFPARCVGNIILKLQIRVNMYNNSKSYKADRRRKSERFDKSDKFDQLDAANEA